MSKKVTFLFTSSQEQKEETRDLERQIEKLTTTTLQHWLSKKSYLILCYDSFDRQSCLFTPLEQ